MLRSVAKALAAASVVSGIVNLALFIALDHELGFWIGVGCLASAAFQIYVLVTTR